MTCPYLVMRLQSGTRQPKIIARFTTADLAQAFAIGWLAVDRRFHDRSLLWVAKVRQSATRAPR